MGLDCTEKEKNARLCFFCGSRALFTGFASTNFSKFFLKRGLTGLFTHLKIILLQCFQFSIINGIQMDSR